MPRFRLSRPAQADLARILAATADRWGEDGRRRYSALLAAAMRRIAAQPEARLTRARRELLPDLRSFHIRHARADISEPRIGRPAPILYDRPLSPDLIEIVRVLHERMDPAWHLTDG